MMKQMGGAAYWLKVILYTSQIVLLRAFLVLRLNPIIKKLWIMQEKLDLLIVF